MAKIGRRRERANGGGKKTIKLTVNIEEKYMDFIQREVASGKYRNRTHFIEEAIKKMEASQQQQQQHNDSTTTAA